MTAVSDRPGSDGRNELMNGVNSKAVGSGQRTLSRSWMAQGCVRNSSAPSLVHVELPSTRSLCSGRAAMGVVDRCAVPCWSDRPWRPRCSWGRRTGRFEGSLAEGVGRGSNCASDAGRGTRGFFRRPQRGGSPCIVTFLTAAMAAIVLAGRSRYAEV